MSSYNDSLEKLNDADEKLSSIQWLSWIHPGIEKSKKEVTSLIKKLKSFKEKSYFENDFIYGRSNY